MRRFAIPTVLASLALALPAGAQLSKADQKAAEKLTSGTLYMRVDAPAATGRHAYGTYTRPLVEVSPEGVNTDADTIGSASWWHSDSTYWGILINHPVKVEDIDFDDDEPEVELELEGVGPAEDEDTAIKFVGIHSLADFQAAFDLAFSRQPLQEEHADWSADVKQAIANRELREGMNKRQVFYITGKPERFEKSNEGGKEVEIWHLRQSKGVKTGYWVSTHEEESLPSTLRFEDGTLVGVTAAGGRESFSLD